MSGNNKSNNLPVSEVAAALRKEESNVSAKKEIEAKDVVRNEQQQKSLQQAAKQSSSNVRTSTLSRSERAADRLDTYLNILATASPEDSSRTEAWRSLIEIVTVVPKKSVLDKILAFFVSQKDNPYLSEMYALSTIMQLDKTINQRVRVLYGIFHGLAHKRHSKKTIDMNNVRAIFQSDDLVNWVASVLNRQDRERNIRHRR